MAKYSQQELKRMAAEVIESENQGDDRAFELVMRLAMNLGLTPREVVSRIEELAAA